MPTTSPDDLVYEWYRRRNDWEQWSRAGFARGDTFQACAADIGSKLRVVVSAVNHFTGHRAASAEDVSKGPISVEPFVQSLVDSVVDDGSAEFTVSLTDGARKSPCTLSLSRSFVTLTHGSGASERAAYRDKHSTGRGLFMEFDRTATAGARLHLSRNRVHVIDFGSSQDRDVFWLSLSALSSKLDSPSSGKAEVSRRLRFTPAEVEGSARAGRRATRTNGGGGRVAAAVGVSGKHARESDSTEEEGSSSSSSRSGSSGGNSDSSRS